MVDDWPSYNEALVRRDPPRPRPPSELGRGTGGDEQGQAGRQIPLPNNLIELQASLRAYLMLLYRQLEGFTRALSRWEPRLRTPDYSTTCREVYGLDVDLGPRLDPDEPVTIAVDASGVKVADRGEWMRACPRLIPITTIAARNGPKAARTKKGVRLSSGTDDSAGINMAQVMQMLIRNIMPSGGE